MAIIARKYNPKKTKFNQLQGSGILPRPPFCTTSKCLPAPNPIPSRPTPQTLEKGIPEPLIAVKQSPKDNKWELNGQKFPDFNSLWVNIPRMSFTILRTNG